MENFNCLSSNLEGDFICEDMGSNKASLASIYEDDCTAAKAASMLKSNIGTWEWQPIQNESIYRTDKCYGEEDEGEAMDEAIERIVKEVASKLIKKEDLETTPKIEKYHLKHK